LPGMSKPRAYRWENSTPRVETPNLWEFDPDGKAKLDAWDAQKRLVDSIATYEASAKELPPHRAYHKGEMEGGREEWVLPRQKLSLKPTWPNKQPKKELGGRA